MSDPLVEELLEGLYVREVEQGGAAGQRLTDGPALRAALSEGFVELLDGACILTARGREAGRDVVRRHRLAERLLRDVLAAPREYMEEDACGFEHVLLHGLDEKVCALLGHPSHCPHGRPIPEGECCRKARADHVREVGPLSEARPDAEGVIAYLRTRDSREVQKLMAMGVLPGTRIKLLQRFPSFVFQIGFSQFTVDRELADAVLVRWKV